MSQARVIQQAIAYWLPTTAHSNSIASGGQKWNGGRTPLALPLETVMAQNKPSTVLSSNVQSIDHGLTVLDDETTDWLLNTCPEI